MTQPTPADIRTRPGRGWRPTGKGLVILLAMGLLAWTLARCQHAVGRNAQPVGFSQGLWHGAIMPCALPLLLLGRDVTIYAPNNVGRTYNLGYTLGVNACGLVFFGFLFTRLRRWRNRLAKPGPQT